MVEEQTGTQVAGIPQQEKDADPEKSRMRWRVDPSLASPALAPEQMVAEPWLSPQCAAQERPRTCPAVTGEL